jgi:hypothetical protein
MLNLLGKTINKFDQNQNQNAGDNSNNQQAGRDIYNIYGVIDERRAREIINENFEQLKNNYTGEALKILQERLSNFENILMTKMQSVDGALEEFRDPSFQILLKEAQKTAASTERPVDYELLSELLIHRCKKGDDRIVKSGINRAVEIVDEISDDALIGLTLFHTVKSVMPPSGNISQGLDELDDLYGKILYGTLPSGIEWLDHLDILNAVRLRSSGKIYEIEKILSQMLSGYSDVGIKKDADDFKKAIEILEGNELPTSMLVDHELNFEYVRIDVSNKWKINLITGISENQKKALISVYELYDKNMDLRIKNIISLGVNMDKRKNIYIIKKWWNSLNANFEITSVGRVLAHSNAQRCDRRLPALY